MIINEMEQSYDIELEFSHFDRSGIYTPAGYQSLATSLVDKHLRNYDLNFEKLFAKGISWVLLSLTIDIHHPISDREQKLIGRTWFSEHKGIYFRREVSIHSEEGTPILSCTLYSTLFDMEKRSIYKSRELPFVLMPVSGNPLTEAKPTFKEKLVFESVEKREVRRSYLDMLGHVNNSRYGDFCYDALDDSEAMLEHLRHIEIYFVSELKFKEVFSMNKTIRNGDLILQGYNESQQKPAFYGVLSY